MEKKFFIRTFLHYILKYAKFVKYSIILEICIYMHQKPFSMYFLLIKSSQFLLSWSCTLLKEICERIKIRTLIMMYLLHTCCVVNLYPIYTVDYIDYLFILKREFRFGGVCFSEDWTSTVVSLANASTMRSLATETETATTGRTKPCCCAKPSSK